MQTDIYLLAAAAGAADRESSPKIADFGDEPELVSALRIRKRRANEAERRKIAVCLRIEEAVHANK